MGSFDTKNVKSGTLIKKIVVCGFYNPPKSNTKFKLLDHICANFHLLAAKYGQAVHFIMAGDANEMKLDPILQLSSTLRQVVTDFTRYDPPAILDPIITDMPNFYQTPRCLEPLGPNQDSSCVKSDHMIVLFKPVNVLENKCSRTYREIVYRPITESGMQKLHEWFQGNNWDNILDTNCVNTKAELLHTMILEKTELFLPLKKRKIAIDDQPWYTNELKVLKRKKNREYKKNRKSNKYHILNKKYENKIQIAKQRYKKTRIDDVLNSNDRQWYSKLKRMTNYDQQKF